MTISFTPKEQTHAQQVVDTLLRECRFFIDETQDDFNDGFKYYFPKKIFLDSLQLQSKLVGYYNRTRDETEQKILTLEEELGFSKPQIPKNKTMVTCSKYTGGFDIKSVFPLSFLLGGDVLSPDRIKSSLLKSKMGNKTSDDYSPNDMKTLTESVEKIQKKILHQYSLVENHENFKKLSVVILHSRFDLDGSGIRNDLSKGKLDHIQVSPELLGYLFYEKSKSTRLISNNSVLFGTSRASHVMLNHSSQQEASILYSYNTGYDCRVDFAAIF